MRVMVLIFVACILIGVVLVLTGYEPLTGYGPPLESTTTNGPGR